MRRKQKKKQKGVINGVRGVISLFLALIMLPFLSIALLLTESARYQHVTELVTEIMDNAGFSAIANYDEYLEERFDLLAISQKTDPSSNAEAYFSENLTSMGNSFSLESFWAPPATQLHMNSVLREEILEYGEITIAGELLYEGLNIEDMLEELYKALGMEELNKEIDAITKTAEVAEETANLINSIKECIEEYSIYSAAKSEYDNAANDFFDRSEELIQVLNDSSAAGNEEGLYEIQAVKDAVEKTEKARDTFAVEAGEMSAAVSDMRSAIDSLKSAVSDIAEKIGAAKNAYGEAGEVDDDEETSSSKDATKTTGDWIIDIVDELTNIIETEISISYSEEMLEQSRLLDAQKIKVKTIVCNRESDGSSDFYYIDKNRTIDDVKADFSKVTTNTVSSQFSVLLNRRIDEMGDNNGGMSDDQKNKLQQLLDLLLELLNINFVYDGSLNANVSPTAFLPNNSCGPSWSSSVLITSITRTVGAGQDFVDGIKEKNLIKILANLAKFLRGIVEFLVGIIAWAGQTLVNLALFVANIRDVPDNLILAGYGIYNLPCRTTYEAGETLSGYSYKKIFELMGGTTGNRFSGALKNLDTLAESGPAGTAKGFKGAETEYLLVGDTNEIRNQCVTFLNLYLLRLLLDLKTILSNAQVKAMAAPFTVGAWVVYLVLIITEPLIDALMLVNGESIHLIKNQVYLTPEGLILLAQQLPGITGFSESSQSEIKDLIETTCGKQEAEGFLSMNYQEHLMILLLLSVDQYTMIDRLQNIIQMEAVAHYEKEGAPFTLYGSATGIQIFATGRVNGMFKLESLANGGGFTISRRRYVGY